MMRKQGSGVAVSRRSAAAPSARAAAAPPIFGRVLVQGETLDIALLGASRESQRRIVIPNDSKLIGLHVTYQSATIDPATGLIIATNAIDHFVNP